MFLTLSCVSAVEDNQTAGHVVLEDDSVGEEVLAADSEATFTDLSRQFESSNFTLEKDFTFNPDTDASFEGNSIKIDNDNIVIDGKGHTINALGKCAIFDIQGNNVTLNNINFINAKSNGSGAAVNFSRGGTIINCSFTGNYAVNGGAVFANDTSTIRDSKFYANHAEENGGAVYSTSVLRVENCQVEDNSAGNSGGAIYSTKNCFVNGSSFINNNAINGGAVFFLSRGEVYNSNFEYNCATTSGGALYFNLLGIVENSNFTRNNGANGGVIHSFSSLNLTNCDFIKNNGTNGFVILSEGEANIYSSKIDDNTGDGAAIQGSVIRSNNTRFSNNIATDSGVINTNQYCEINNCEFENNTASACGAIRLYSGLGIVTNSTFTNNRATVHGVGAIVSYDDTTLIIKDSNFTGNSAEGSNGGAINCYGVTIDNCIFQDNSADNGSGIYTHKDANINNSKFINNVADNFGGAMYVENSAVIFIENSIFEGNRGKGASYNIYLPPGSRLHEKNLTPQHLIPLGFRELNYLITNSAGNTILLEDDFKYLPEQDSDLSPGGIEINRDNIIIDGQGCTIDADGKTRIFYIKSDNVTLKNINFINGYLNSNMDSGAALRIDGNATIDNCKFENNSQDFGAAIYHYTSSASLKVINSRFTNNRGKMGMAIYTYNSLSVDNCTFINNSGTGSGGAIHMRSSGTISNSTFINNNANIKGGAIYAAQRNCVVINCTFCGNSADNGGAIFFEKNAKVTDCVFEDNIASAADYGGGAITFNDGGSVTNSTFINNSAKNIGGAIKGSATITQSSFTGNHADNNGGAIFNQGGTITYSNFTSNSANNNGGGIYTESGELNHLNFVENSAKNGGGLYSQKGKIHYLNFVGNTATNGGGLYLPNARDVIECTFSANTARDKGGAISLNGNSTIDKSNFANNSAKNGGAIYNNNVLTINNTNFKGDHAYSGGAIQISDDLDIHNTNFEDNVATDGTNYINLIGDVKITLDNITPEHVNPYKVSVITITYATNGTAYGDNAYVALKVFGENKPLTEGFVVITLNNENYTSEVINGSALINLSAADCGSYAGNITYLSYNYTVESAYIEFYVVRKEVSFTVNITNITVDETLRFTVNLDNVNSGTVSAIINNKEYVEEVINGAATFEIPKLNADNYSALISYNGGFNYYCPAEYIYFTVLKRDVSLEVSTENIAQGEVLKITAKVNNDDTVINDGFIKITIYNETYIEYVNNGIATFEIPNLDVGDYTCNVSYIGGQNNTDQMKTVNFIVYERIYSIVVDAENITYGDTAKITVNVMDNAGSIVKGRIFLEIDENVYEKALQDGSATFEIPMLDIGVYVGNIVFYSEDGSIFQKENFTYGVRSPKAIFLNASGIPNDIYYGDKIIITVNVTSVDEIIDNGTVSIYLNNERFDKSVENGTVIFEAPTLDAGTYAVNITFDGGNHYAKPTISSQFNVLKRNATISASDNSYVINYGGKYSATIKGVVGEKVTFTLDGKVIGSAITNANGVATISLSAKILKATKAGTKNMVIKLDNPNYQPNVKKVKITVNKEKTKLVAKNKKFKKAKKVKKYTISLKNSKGKAVKNVKVTLKIKKKTYNAKTNAKGKAIFKIKKLTKNGNFKAKITFKGNQYYEKITKKVKIKVRG